MSINVEGGLGRLARGLRVVGKVWFWGVVILTGAGIGLTGDLRGGDLWAVLLMALLVAAFPAGITLGAAWLIDGFLEPKR